MDKTALKSFADKWLTAWTGNRPELLLGFYTEETFYLDPAYPNGITGKSSLSAYFSKLLSKNPDWIWSAEEIMPTEKGFTLKWKAVVPVKNKRLTLYGLDIVELSAGKISRNEVYFDRHEWMIMLQSN